MQAERKMSPLPYAIVHVKQLYVKEDPNGPTATYNAAESLGSGRSAPSARAASYIYWLRKTSHYGTSVLRRNNI